MNRSLKFGIQVFGGMIVGLAAGCGALTAQRMVFPDSVIGTDGTTITRAEIDSILADENLSDGEKTDALRDLGIEDEELLAILVAI